MHPVYTAYYTLPNKDRLSVLDVLRNGCERRFRLNQEALGYLENVQLSKSARQTLQTWSSETEMDPLHCCPPFSLSCPFDMPETMDSA